MKTIIFDFDGVLIETTKTKYESMLSLSEWVKPNLSLKLQQMLNDQFIGATRYDICNWLIKQTCHSDLKMNDLLFKLKSILEDNSKKIFFPTENKKILSELKAKNIDIYILSMAPSNEIIEYLGDSYTLFKEIWGSDNLNGSTKLQLVKIIKEKQNCNKDDIIFFGDTPSDLMAAEKNEVQFIRITSFIGNLSKWPHTNFKTFDNLSTAYHSLLEGWNVC